MSRTRSGNAKPTPSNLKEIKGYADSLKKGIDDQQQIELPVFAYYGTGRGQIVVPERKRNFQKIYPRWDCYNNALEPDTNFKRFFAWFDMMEDEERRTRDDLWQREYRLPLLENVRRAIERLVTNTDENVSFSNPRIEIHPLRFVMDELSTQGSRQIRIEQMSDGFKMITAMTADIAARMSEANPDMRNPLEAHGIVLIDEIDLHLHPRWQRHILHQLHEVFPNIQFIVSTHSPIVVLGASDVAQIIHLTDEGNVESYDKEQYANYDVNRMLLSLLFNIGSAYAPRWDDKLKARDSLLQKESLTEDDRNRLRELNEEMKAISMTSSNDILIKGLLGALQDLKAGKN